MTAYRLSTYVRLALVAAAVGNLTACAATGDYYEPSPYYASPGNYSGDYYGDYYDYWYYPAIGSYYDPRARLYMYYEHDHWIRSHALPRHYRPYLGNHVTVHSRHDRPYEDHYKHRERYTPERYKSERYRHSPSDRNGNDVWIGAPRRPTPDRYRDDRRTDNGDRDKGNRDNGNRNNGDRNRNDRDQSRDFDRNRDSYRRIAPVQQQNTERARETRKENAWDRYRVGDVRRGNDQNRGASSIQPQYRERAPAAQQPPTKTQPRKDEKERDDKRNKNDASSQTPQPGPFDRYNNFR